tara:strand:- start:3327 stop:3659 length:333 start_codon:yes stop_codon:yes gene_type:complete
MGEVTTKEESTEEKSCDKKSTSKEGIGKSKSQKVDEKEWRLFAACSGLPTEWFYPINKNKADIKKAKTVCSGCFVQVECLTYAVENGEEWGVWGGVSSTVRLLENTINKK